MTNTILSSTVISINIYDEEIDVEHEIENIIDSDEICDTCEEKKNSIMTLGEYLIIELNSMPASKIL